MNKKTNYNILIIILLFISIFAIVLDTRYLFGNTNNYFLENNIINMFKTNQITNIYSYAKYGYFNPLLVITRLLLSNNYNSIYSILSIIISIILLYYFFTKNKYKSNITIISISYIIINTLLINNIFNSISDILTIPFIILSFIGLKERVDNNKIPLLSISIFLVTISNYTLLIPTIVSLTLYSTYLFLNNNETVFIKKYLTHMKHTLIPILCGILLSSYILLPVITNNTLTINNIITVNKDIHLLLLLAIIFNLSSTKDNKFLSVCIIILTLFFSKYYICYMFLLSILFYNSINILITREENNNYLLITLIISIIISIFINNLLIELLIIYLIIFIYIDTKKELLLVIPILLFIYITTITSLLNTNYISKDLDYNIYQEQDNNILLNMLTNKSISKEEMIGYEKVNNKDVYYNSNVLPIGFATNSIMSYTDYNKLNNLEKQEVKLSTIIADTISNNEYTSFVKELNKNTNKYILDLKEITTYTFDLKENNKNKIIYIEFIAKSDNCNSSIKINHINKKVTCKEKKYSYTISDKETDRIYVNLSKGNYTINNIKVYSLDYANIEESKIELDEYIPITKDTGKINVLSDNSYFVITKPYDKKYQVRLDGKSIKYEKVDEDYIGFPISKGTHIIKITKDIKENLFGYFFTYLGIVFTYVINYLERLRKFT